MSRFRIPLGYGMLDQIFGRVFDFATLWVVLRTLPDTDLAAYGIATAMLFLFNLVFVAPEASLMRDKKSWVEQGVLTEYLFGFVLFAELRIVIVCVVAAVVGLSVGWDSAYFFACILGLVHQFIQLAELVRLDFRVDLQQKQVFKAEIALKALLLVFVSVMFIRPELRTYLIVFLAWAAIGALYWSWKLKKKHHVGFNLQWQGLNRAWDSLRDFAFWQHLSGVVTYTIYNIDPWVLSWFSTKTETISTYTLALKVSALFFAVPMFLQSMTTILLVNCKTEEHKRSTFRKAFVLNAVLSLGQFGVFLIAGEWIGWIFRGENLDGPLFYELGLYLSVGVVVLNFSRPLIAELILHAPMKRLLVGVYIPALALAFGLYIAFTAGLGAKGCAIASALAYSVFAGLLFWQTGRYGIARVALLRRSGVTAL